MTSKLKLTEKENGFIQKELEVLRSENKSLTT